MKINDQGFTERLPGQTSRTTSVGGSGFGASSASGARQNSDRLQLSNLASRLQSTSINDSERASRVSQIAKAVGNNTFRIDPAQISSAIISEAVQSAAR